MTQRQQSHALRSLAFALALTMPAAPGGGGTIAHAATSGAAPSPTAPAASSVDAQAVAPRPADASRPSADAGATVEGVLGSATHPWLKWGAIADVAGTLKPLYAAETDRLLWFDGATASSGIDASLAAIAAADGHGLDPADYDAALLQRKWTEIKAGGAAPADRALFDVAVSVAVARLLKTVHSGRVDPATMLWGYDVGSKAIDIGAALQRIRQGQALGAALDALQPPFSHYLRARTTLAAYRALEKAGEPEPVPGLAKGQTKIAPGAAWPGVPQLAARLRVLGDLDAAAPVAVPGAKPVYAGALVEAVKRFQTRHVLEPDGVIGAATIKAINVPLSARIKQIELAMERMRWLPDLSGEPNIFVNVALFRLWATDPAAGEAPLRMNVVVGKAIDHNTPIFIDRMEYVIFRPYWNPPRSITMNELLPKARKDPAYMAREALEIVASGDDDAPELPATPANLSAVAGGRLFIRQKPGPQNSLGLAKFIFPNADSIYMHGTPVQPLFARARRDFSHGCIRLEDAARFAEWVLRDRPEWTRERIDAAMAAERPTRVNLKTPVTVVLFYDTVHVNSEGVVFFAEDIYGHDRELADALTRGYPYPVKK